MAKKQSRRSISVRGVTYNQLREYCGNVNISISDFLEQRIADYFTANKVTFNGPGTIAKSPFKPMPRPAAAPPVPAGIPRPAAATPARPFNAVPQRPAFAQAPRPAVAPQPAAPVAAARPMTPVTPIGAARPIPASSSIVSRNPTQIAARRSVAITPQPTPAAAAPMTAPAPTRAPAAGRPGPTPASEVLKDRPSSDKGDPNDYRVIRF